MLPCQRQGKPCDDDDGGVGEVDNKFRGGDSQYRRLGEWRNTHPRILCKERVTDI